MYLSDAIFVAFLAPPEYAIQVQSDFGGIVLNIAILDDGEGPPLLGAGVIGSSWPSNYVTEPDLVQYGGYPDLGSFAGGIALATGSFNPGVVPDWEFGLPGPTDETAANLYTSSGFPVVEAVTQLTVRNVIPEPSAIVLAGMGLMGLAAGRRRR